MGRHDGRNCRLPLRRTSAPLKALQQHYASKPDSVVAIAKELLGKNRRARVREPPESRIGQSRIKWRPAGEHVKEPACRRGSSMAL
jgi:hypothetical protein